MGLGRRGGGGLAGAVVVAGPVESRGTGLGGDGLAGVVTSSFLESPVGVVALRTGGPGRAGGDFGSTVLGSGLDSGLGSSRGSGFGSGLVSCLAGDAAGRGAALGCSF